MLNVLGLKFSVTESNPGLSVEEDVGVAGDNAWQFIFQQRANSEYTTTEEATSVFTSEGGYPAGGFATDTLFDSETFMSIDQASM